MYNQTTFIFMQIFVFFCGAIFGAGIFYFLKQKFVKGLEKLLINNSSEFQEIVFQNVKETNSKFRSYTKLLAEVSDETLKIQQDILDTSKSIDNNFAKFNKEIQSTHHVRQSLENEIIKLKNIIKRYNKQKEQ